MMRKKRRKSSWRGLLSLALAAFAIVASQAADTIIYLRNGDRLSGKITSENSTDLTLEAGRLGKVVIPIGEISKREEVGAATTAAPATNQVSVPVAPPGTPPAAVVVTPPPKHWNSEIQLGLNLRYTTRDQQEGLVIAKSSYNKGRFREIFDYNFTYGQTEKIRTANRMTGASKTEWDFTPRTYAFGLAGASYDEIRKIDRQFELNPGVGHTWLNSSNLVFKTEIGLGYQDQFFADGSEVNTYAGRLAAIFTWRIWGKLMSDGRVEYFPSLLAADEYRFRFESTLRYPLSKNLSINLVVLDLYDTAAPPGVENNDLQVRSAVGVKF
jgi:putative salt-induced outer membrane protein YdiY